MFFIGRINVLPQSVAELIAAGEVIDRPSSIVKELVENAIDAGADRITVELKHGGISFISVSDNGCGMGRDDVSLAFIRHATSKITAADDLNAIATLGFRGEALPSIAAVSRVKVTTRTADDPLGCSFFINGNGETRLEDAGCAVGTVVEVRDLFYNTPARMKFLKKDVTEGNAVASLIDRLALANPSIAFQLIRDGKRTLQTSGSGELLSAVRLVCGAEVASGMIPVSYESGGVKVSGVISRPSVNRATRSLQTFFINSRFVRSKTCAGAVEEAYKNRLMTGRFPACVLNLEIDCSQVDVNVHPAKLEVRFSDERLIYNTVYSACMETLAQQENRIADTRPKKITHFSVSDFNYSDRQLTFVDSPVKPRNLTASKPLGNTVLPSLTAAISSKPVQPMVLRDDSKTTFQRPEVLNTRETTPVKAGGFGTKRGMLDIECDEPENEDKPQNVTSARENREKSFGVNDSAVEHDTHDTVVSSAHDVVAAVCKPDKTSEKPLTEISYIDTAEQQSIPQPATEQVEPVEQKAQPRREYRIIGELFDTYILIEQGDGFIIIDKHAAHERYIYNGIKHLEKGGDRQLLLTPQAVTLPRDEYFALTENPQALEVLGIIAEDFGEGTLLVREIPMLLNGFELSQLLGEVAKRVLSQRNSPTPEMLDELLYSVSCRAAVMAGKRSAMPELECLADMVINGDIRHCPHGRPVLITLSKRDVEKMFGRMG